MAGGDY
jgi:ATP-dependent Zn protease